MMRAAGDGRHGCRLRGLIVVLSRAGLRIHEAVALNESDAQHIAADYRPRSSLVFFSRLLRESLAGTPYAGRVLAGRA